MATLGPRSQIVTLSGGQAVAATLDEAGVSPQPWSQPGSRTDFTSLATPNLSSRPLTGKELFQLPRHWAVYVKRDDSLLFG